MKHWLLILLLVAGHLDIHATGIDESAQKANKDPLYFQAFVGINKSANENLPWTELSKYPWAGGLFIGLGKEFSPLWGWRVVLRYNHNKSRNVPKCEQADTYSWNNIAAFGDLTFDITDLFRKEENEEGKFNLKFFAGAGLAYTYGFDKNKILSYDYTYSTGNKLLPGVRAGLNASYKVDDNLLLGAELSHSLFTDWFNGVKAGKPFDMRSNLKIGLTYLFATTAKKKVRVTRFTQPTQPIEYDNRLREVPALPYIMPQMETSKVRYLEGRAFLDFPVNGTAIDPKYRRNPQELARIKKTIDNALFDKTIEVKSISLHGYASPESPYSNNVRLAKGRTESLKAFLEKKYNVHHSKFKVEYTAEDWQNLRQFIDAGDRRKVKGDVWYDNAAVLETPETPDVVKNSRAELLEVIDMDIDEDKKEDLLKQVDGGKPYQWLYKYVYPGLRHTDYVIEYVVRSYPVKEAKKLIYTHPEGLSLQEMYMVAQSYKEGSDDWLDAMLIAAKQNPDDTTANFNAACACVKVKRLVDAKRYLSKAGNTEQTQYIADIIRAMEGSAKWRIDNGKLIIQ